MTTANSVLLDLRRADGASIRVERASSGHVAIRVVRPGGELIAEVVHLHPREIISVQTALSKAVARGAR